jgi:hypothetical protein
LGQLVLKRRGFPAELMITFFASPLASTIRASGWLSQYQSAKIIT